MHTEKCQLREGRDGGPAATVLLVVIFWRCFHVLQSSSALLIFNSKAGGCLKKKFHMRRIFTDL